MSLKHQQAAQEMLDAVDAFMSGQKMTKAQDELQNAVFKAGCFAAEAYDAHPIADESAVLPLTRVFLLALVDPLSEELDPLRADPESGEKARNARRKAGDA